MCRSELIVQCLSKKTKRPWLSLAPGRILPPKSPLMLAPPWPGPSAPASSLCGPLRQGAPGGSAPSGGPGWRSDPRARSRARPSGRVCGERKRKVSPVMFPLPKPSCAIGMSSPPAVRVPRGRGRFSLPRRGSGSRILPPPAPSILRGATTPATPRRRKARKGKRRSTRTRGP